MLHRPCPVHSPFSTLGSTSHTPWPPAPPPPTWCSTGSAHSMAPHLSCMFSPPCVLPTLCSTTPNLCQEAPSPHTRPCLPGAPQLRSPTHSLERFASSPAHLAPHSYHLCPHSPLTPLGALVWPCPSLGLCPWLAPPTARPHPPCTGRWQPSGPTLQRAPPTHLAPPHTGRQLSLRPCPPQVPSSPGCTPNPTHPMQEGSYSSGCLHPSWLCPQVAPLPWHWWVAIPAAPPPAQALITLRW